MAICGVEVRANDVDAMMRGAGQAFKKTFAEGFVRKPWMSLKTGQNYRLPSEAEGEYAARAGVKKRFWRLGESGLCGGSFGDSSRLRYDSDVRYEGKPFSRSQGAVLATWNNLWNDWRPARPGIIKTP